MSDYRIARRTLLRTAGAGIVGGTLATSTGAAADDAAGYSFLEVDQISEGEVANVTIRVEESGTATVVLGDDQDGHVSAVELEEIEDEEIVLQYDVSAANDANGGFGWSVRDDSAASIANVEVDTLLEENQSLPAHAWDLSIGEGLDASDGTYAVEEEYDRNVLIITDRESSDDAADYSFVDIERISEGEVANVTIGVDGSSTAAVVLGSDEDGHVSAVELEGTESEELVLQYDVSAANDPDSEFGWSVRDGSDASITNVEIDTRLEENQSLPAHAWDLSIGDGLDTSGGTYTVDEAYDRDVLVVTERFEVGEYEPTDSTGDGLYNDITGNNQTTHDDVTAFFEHVDDDAVQNNPAKFDFDGDGGIGFGDVVALLRRV